MIILYANAAAKHNDVIDADITGADLAPTVFLHAESKVSEVILLALRLDTFASVIASS